MAEEYATRIGYLRELTNEEESTYREKQAAEEKYTNEIYGTGIISDRIFANLNKYSHEEYQYINIIENIIENGFW